MSRQATVVKIREMECIGCTKCIQACPVDAIIGSHSLMHTVILDECIGCGLCLPPCPVDCMDVIEAPNPVSLMDKKQRANLLKKRHQARKKRLNPHQQDQPLPVISEWDKKAYIQAALLRTKLKK